MMAPSGHGEAGRLIIVISPDKDTAATHTNRIILDFCSAQCDIRMKNKDTATVSFRAISGDLTAGETNRTIFDINSGAIIEGMIIADLATGHV
ncbi:MAG: hypothetical protein ACLR23_16030 [Clostridia bacterium]